MRRGKPHMSELVARLVEIGTQRLVDDAAMDTEQARFIMRETAHSWCSECGGEQFHLPKDMLYPLDKRDRQIWEKFTGDNVWQLSVEFKMTPRQVRYILAVLRKQVNRLNQLELPGIDSPNE